ncbi:hypothetical protein QOT17_013917 [Balamuthia mandrillaris]
MYEYIHKEKHSHNKSGSRSRPEEEAFPLATDALATSAALLPPTLWIRVRVTRKQFFRFGRPREILNVLHDVSSLLRFRLSSSNEDDNTEDNFNHHHNNEDEEEEEVKRAIQLLLQRHERLTVRKEVNICDHLFGLLKRLHNLYSRKYPPSKGFFVSASIEERDNVLRLGVEEKKQRMTSRKQQEAIVQEISVKMVWSAAVSPADINSIYRDDLAQEWQKSDLESREQVCKTIEPLTEYFLREWYPA